MTVTLADVRHAATQIHGNVERTPCLHSHTLSQLTGCELYIKFENHQFTAAFKERGALNHLLSLSPQERARGVIAMSAGNHAQAVAYHAQRLGIRATIVMPRHTPNLKVRNTRALGANVHLVGDGVAEAGDYAFELAARHDLVFVHPYDDERIIAGQGTIALEMLEDVPDLDCLVIPIGGGGLISGNAVAAKALKPDIEMIGVQTKRFPAMQQALAGEPIQCGLATLAEGIAVKQPGKLTQAIVRDLVGDIVLVDEPEIERAILMLLEIEKSVAEGAGAAGLAAVLADPERYRGRRVGLILCGGNIDMLALSSVIQRGLVRSGRIVRVRVAIPDVPGALAELTQLLARERANVIQIAHQRTFTDLSLRATEVEATLETLGSDHTRDVIEALRAEGYDPVLPANEVHPDERWATTPEGH
ncbi:threonine ammonia-lyase [Halomonas urumqiensis]|uniref:Threonine ammonia-lyase n=1 Tax=Halomonas urumqiensis TaxID=1684789 RepID=A0A2N7UD02_9GAMM|nr:threonine ammonia-lyase [Halomonas urumqiensis]PMR78336.1 threonine ammonia-lyase [Halomonas urumqiensis]PTB03483.1 threonine ammonia-lyase [Halomonas urumqiensis]GHE20330.1 threonine ammonia-lyase [Halomonas urumqiensis]